MELWIDLRRVDREGTDRPDRADASLYFGHRRFLPDQVSRHARTTIRGAVISNVRRIGWNGRACGLRCFRRQMGRAAGRERAGQYGSLLVEAVALKKKTIIKNNVKI